MAGKTEKQAPACPNVIPLSIAKHNAKRPAGPSFALPMLADHATGTAL